MVAQTILATLTGSGPHQRLQVALRQAADGSLVIELRDQHYGGEAVGWFDQRTMSLEPRQWKQLQTVLGSKTAAPAAGGRVGVHAGNDPVSRAADGTAPSSGGRRGRLRGCTKRFLSGASSLRRRTTNRRRNRCVVEDGTHPTRGQIALLGLPASRSGPQPAFCWDCGLLAPP